MRAVYTITVFLGALLLFAVQPLMGKLLLPRLGGTPAVWNTCMVFFQVALLAGYAYAHLLAKLRSLRWQVVLHGAVLTAGIIALPIGLREGAAPPTADSPIPWLVAALALSVGLPFFAVSTNAPLLQRWFAATDDPNAGDPYFLYVASNTGSLLALLAYPLLLEPLLPLELQRYVWTAAYVGFAGLVVTCGVILLRRGGRPATVTDPAQSSPPPAARDYLSWCLLAFVPSSLMLGVTQYITTDVAAIPLLWVVPLGIYLLTFILAFVRRHTVRPAFWSVLFVLLAFPALAISSRWTSLPVTLILVMHLAMLFVGAMVCHGRLARTRPDPLHLTGFFLAIAVGGALGGVFNALVAPHLFDAVLEYPLVIGLAFLLRDRSAFGRPGTSRARWGNLGLDAGMVVLVAVSIPTFMSFPDLEVIESDRTFFGVHRVVADEERYWLGYFNGTTLHNVRIADHPGVPLAYYHDGTGVGQLYLRLAGDPRLDQVGLVGLGAGALLARAGPGQHYSIFEIDPAVVRIASEHFSYLSNMPETPRIVLGDARLSLAQEPDGELGLLVLDAFSSDAVPVHLLTLEAIDLYFDKLRPDGLLAVHVTNRHLDLHRLVSGLVHERGLVAAEWPPATELKDSYYEGILAARWLVVARSEAALASLLADPLWQVVDPPDGAPVWTDDFSNTLAIMKWWH